jgi:putative heme iron utilization protein
MNPHADSGPSGPQPPEPSFAERARTLIHVGRTGTLATLCLRRAGHPFASVAPYGLDAQGRPILLLSAMAMHTQHLAADARASLLVTDPGWTDDPLAGARATLLGSVRTVEPADAPAVRADYLARHETAWAWVDFDDFAFYRLEVADCYFVGGFGAMGWVAAEEYGAAEPDPLADVAPGILAHMNADHGDALVLYCRAFADFAADAATMTAVDRLGFRVRARSGEQLRSLRIGFPREVRTAAQARTVLVEMVRAARARAGSG